MRLVYLADAPYIHTRRWVESSVAAGRETHLISFRAGEIPGATVHHIGGLEAAGRLRYLAHAPRIRRLVAGLQPDLVHGLHLTSYGFLASLTDARPRIVSVWGTDILEAPSWSPMHFLITRYALQNADMVTATGYRLANATLRYLPPRKTVTVTPYGVDTGTFSPGTPVSPTDNVTLGFAGRLSIEKGLAVLLQAVARLIERGVRARLLVAGEGPQRGPITKLAASLNLENNVELHGHIAHGDMPEFLRKLDIFVMPSRAEGFGVAALEASATGLPIVASRVHGLPDVVIHGKTGLLVPPGDVTALSDAIEVLASSPALRRDMGFAGRAFVKQAYRWQDNVAQMELVYQEALAASASRTEREAAQAATPIGDGHGQ